jgi:hypothetical protein
MPRDSQGRLHLGESPRHPDQAALEQRWLEENAEAIAQYNRRVAEEGLLSDEVGLLTDDEFPEQKLYTED